MKIRHWPALLATLAFVTACAQQDAGADADSEAMSAAADEAAIEAIHASYAEHFNMDHPSVVAAMYNEDAVTIFADVGVQIGRAEIEAGLEQAVAVYDNLAINQEAIHVAGDVALARGTWSTDMAAEGADPASAGGYWMASYTRGEDGWGIKHVASNYSSEMPEEAYGGELSEQIPEEEDAMLDALMTAYEGAWAAGDIEALANLYTEDVHAAFCNDSALEGRAAVQARLEEVHAGTLDIHPKETIDMGDGWYANGGWYEVNDPAGPWGGNYSLLARATEDGGFQTHWIVSNCRPMQAE